MATRRYQTPTDRRAELNRKSLLRTVRVAFLVLLATVVLMAILQIEPGSGQAIGGIALKIGWELIFTVGVVIAAVVFTVDSLTSRRRISTVVAVCLGLVLAMFATWLLGTVLDLLYNLYDVKNSEMQATAKVLMGIGLSYLFITTIIRTQDDFRLVIPYVEFAKQMRGVRPFVLDSSALIDARIVDVAGSGLVQTAFIVPQFVVNELQTLADSTDRLKRARGRRGLDVLARLQRLPGTEVTIDDAPVTPMPVDQMLIEFSQRINGRLVTTDLGLTRVARVQGASVVNLHESAAAFRPSLIAGEHLIIRIIKPGEQPGQGVGYLEDGTMVVVEDAGGRIGHDAGVLVTSTMQTSAGRLVFGKLAERAILGVEDGTDEAAHTSGSHARLNPPTPPPPPPTPLPQARGLAAAPEALSPLSAPAVSAPPASPDSPAAPALPNPQDRSIFRRGGSPRNPRR